MTLPPPATRPTKSECFYFTVPEPVPADDPIEAVVGVRGLQYLQHLGGTKFLCAMSLMAQATKMVVVGCFLVAGKQVPLTQIAAPVVYVTVFRLPPTVTDPALASALGAYRKVRMVSESIFKRLGYVQNGCRTRCSRHRRTSSPSGATVPCLSIVA
ncbi:uncharacterized protein LOC144101988 isoform X1 [Amblyomma americanum]